jgi:FkbM family methyltransferase
VRRGVAFEIDLAEGIDLAMYLGVYERDTHRALRRLVRAGDTVLDIGANVGAHTLPLARMVGSSGHVVAFEPTSFAFDRLLHNLSLNPQLSARVRPVRAYLDDHPGDHRPVAFYARWRLDTASAQHPVHKGSLERADDADAWTLDAYSTAAELGRVAVVKLDVDGFECKVLRGATTLLTRDNPFIVAEICPYALEEHGDSVEDMVALLSGCGYRLFDERSLMPISRDVKALRARIKPQSSINVVALAEPTIALRYPNGVRW